MTKADIANASSAGAGAVSSKPSLANATIYDYFILALIIAIGGSSFAMIKGAVADIPPAVVTVGRLWTGAALMVGFMIFTGRRFPPFFTINACKKTLSAEWKFMMLAGLIGNTFPFFLFPWAQQFVPSALAGVYMAVMPIWTIGLAAIFASEKLTPQRAIGFALGFIGVIILMIPPLFTQNNSSITGYQIDTRFIIAQLAIVIATLAYATSAVLTRRAPEIRPRVFSSGILLSAAIFSTPALFVSPWKMDEWTLNGIFNLIGLGIFPTGIGAILIIILIQRVGAGFMSFANYLTPIWAIVLGFILFGERLNPSVFIALAIVCLGLAVSQWRIRP